MAENPSAFVPNARPYRVTLASPDLAIGEDGAVGFWTMVALRIRRTQDCASALLPCVPRIAHHHCLSPDPWSELDPTASGLRRGRGGAARQSDLLRILQVQEVRSMEFMRSEPNPNPNPHPRPNPYLNPDPNPNPY